MAYLLYGALLVAAVLVEEAVRPAAENHPAIVGVIFGVVVLVVAAPLAFFVGRSGAAPALILVAGFGWGWIAGWDARDNYLTPYCEYGASPRAEVERCLAETNSEDVDALDTPAARHARGEAAD